VALNLARALAQSGEQRELLCVDDELAGVGNRRQFLRLAERDWARCRRYGDDGAMLLIDADYLRRINDTMGQRCGGGAAGGHPPGERHAAPVRCAGPLRRRRAGRVPAAHRPAGALDAAERIRQQVASTPSAGTRRIWWSRSAWAWPMCTQARWRWKG
jgi:hypothetical protein